MSDCVGFMLREDLLQPAGLAMLANTAHLPKVLEVMVLRLIGSAYVINSFRKRGHGVMIG